MLCGLRMSRRSSSSSEGTSADDYCRRGNNSDANAHFLTVLMKLLPSPLGVMALESN
jgi:hypothetical protein